MKVVVVGPSGPYMLTLRGELIREMVRAGHEVWAMAPEDDPQVAAAIKEMGAVYQPLPFRRTSMNPIHDVNGAKRLAEILKEIKPDVVFSYVMRIAIWGSIAASWAKVPRIYAMVNGLGTAFLTKGVKGWALSRIAITLMKNAFKKVDKVIVQNPDDGKALGDFGVIDPGQLVMVSGSGVDLQSYPRAPMPPGPPRVLMIARLLVEKGVREFAAAARIVHQTRPDVIFDLVGPIEDHPSAVTKEELEDWQKQGDIVWHGEQGDVVPFLASCSVYCLPSYREGTPRSVLEALATGRPIVTSDAPGCRETITDGVEGRFAAVQDAESLAKAVLDVVADQRRMEAMAEAAYQRVLDKYDVRIVNRDMIRILGLEPPQMPEKQQGVLTGAP